MNPCSFVDEKRALIVPRLVTPEAPVPVKRRLPEAKSASEMSRVLAVKPAVLTTPPGPIRIPFPLRR